ncbi:MAG: HesA/MoeB/ThiF family protein [Xanthomonadales bacterium]|nr:HesA/MoeB/ThiF family protein [Xanthomonadales bacterium]
MKQRYQSHQALPEFGPVGQERLQSARVALLGLGGIGGPAAMYLAAAGVGRITLCDFDRVSESNLSRQILFTPSDLDRPKTEAAAERLSQLNPDVQLSTVDRRMNAESIADLLKDQDLLIDASDNFATRLAANQACVDRRKPWVMSAAVRFEGQLAVFRPDQGDEPCYRCLYQATPDTLEDCAGAGVFSTAAGTLGLAAAGQAMSLLAGIPVTRGLHLFDAKTMTWTTLRGRRDPNCQVCVGTVDAD